MADWSFFHARVAPRVIGCPAPVVDAELRNAAAEFLSRTRAWREWLEPMNVFDGFRDMEMDLPAGSSVVRIERATLNGAPFPVDGAFELDADPMRGTVGDGISSADRATIVLSRQLPAGSSIQIQASLAPSNEATGVPDHVARNFEDGIAFGALSRIRSIPGQPFSDDARAAADLLLFEREIARVAALVYRSHTNTKPRRSVQWC